MTRSLVAALLALALPLTAADRSLAEAAKMAAPQLKAGCIVTGERMGDRVTFAIAGTPPMLLGAPPEDILFEIGSITKTFTSLLLAQAVVEGKVKLSTTIGELLGPNQDFSDPQVAAITLEQLSTHTSGLPRLPTNLAAVSTPADPYAKYDARRLRADLASVKLEGVPPFRAGYSNYGAGLLGHLLASVYGKPWEALIVEKVCHPLGLNHTQASISMLKLPMAMPYSNEAKGTLWNFNVLEGAGALRSTAADLMKYGEALLHPEKTPLRDAFALALKPHADYPSNGSQIGLGYFLGKDADGNATCGHDGGTGGYCSTLQVVPAKNLVRVILINNSALDGKAVLKALNDGPKEPVKKPAEIKLAPDALAKFTGVYEAEKDARFTVILDAKNQLWVRLTGQPFNPVFPNGPARFFYKVVQAEIQFQQIGGVITGLTLFQNGQEMKAIRTIEPAPSITLHNAKELQPYTGNYSLLGLQEIKVTVKANTLFAQLSGQPAVPVFETTPDTFEYDVVKASLVFTRNDAKQINGLVLHQNGNILPAAKK